MANLKILEREDRAYKNMEAVCALLNAVCRTDTTYRVDVTYFDYGQNWKWTTIINSLGVQILSPREWEQIVTAETVLELAQIVDAIRKDRFFRE